MTSVATLQGLVVAITGGARGIGRATAAALGARGARVVIGDLDGGLAATVARQLGGDVTGARLDVTSRASFLAFLDEVERRVGPLDVLINGAGIMPVGAFADEDEALTARTLAVNLGGVMLGSKLALARMRPRERGGWIVNVAPLPAHVGVAHASYRTAAAGVRAFSHALARELAGSGVSVRLVLAGPTRTEMLAGIRQPRTKRAGDVDAVADAICRALEGERATVTTPSVLAWLARLALTRLLPARWRRRDPDPVARLAYTARIAPGAPPRRDQAEVVASAAASVADAVRGDRRPDGHSD